MLLYLPASQSAHAVEAMPEMVPGGQLSQITSDVLLQAEVS
jgi:hypothetical protein